MGGIPIHSFISNKYLRHDSSFLNHSRNAMNFFGYCSSFMPQNHKVQCGFHKVISLLSGTSTYHTPMHKYTIETVCHPFLYRE
jgi:hypothetical protein